MTNADVVGTPATVHARNVGGISETEVDIPPGVTVLAGRNATNRTSLLQAIMAAMGSSNVSLKGDADAGRVELALGSETYHRTLNRTNGHVSMGGEPYLSDPTTADLFAFLLESNEARLAVVRGDDLRELIMRPVDTDEIRAEIDRLKRERDDVDDRLRELDALKDDLPSLERRRTRLEADIEEKREGLASKEAEIESLDADVGDTREEKDELESRLEDLRTLRSDLEDVRSDIDLQEESIASLRNERAELREELDRLPETPMGDHEHLERELSRLRERKRSLERRVSDLQDVVQFNEGMLSGDGTVVRDVLGEDERAADGVTDRLVSEEPVVCWTCGSEVERQRIDETVERLRSIRQDLTDDVRETEEELQELREEAREHEEQQRRREELDRRLGDIEDEIARREGRIEELRAQRDRLGEEVEATEREVEALESENFSEVLDRHREANQLEFELGRLESELDDVTDRIDTIEGRLSEEDELREHRERIADELEAEQTRIERIERRAVEEFNDRMADVLDTLEYENLARVWIERRLKTVREGRRNVEKSSFELHIVRTTESGGTYEDTIDHLSESEREVTGLVFALAGYLVHDVHETVPFMVLDSLEAIDSERLADLVSYFSEFAEYLVVALLPEDARALSGRCTVVTGI
jgi:DNA repair exonuclease SbcCD ATPase subunit